MVSVPLNTILPGVYLTQTDNVGRNLDENYSWKYLQISSVQYL